MKNLLVAVFGLGIMIMSATVFASEKSIDAKLQLFAPYLGTWESEFTVEEGQPRVHDVSKWERALNGKAIRTLHSINKGEYGGESLIFYDNKKQSLVFYYFTTAGFYTTGTIELLNDTSFIAYEDVTGNQNGITKVKSVSELSTEQLKVSTSYLKMALGLNLKAEHISEARKK